MARKDRQKNRQVVNGQVAPKRFGRSEEHLRSPIALRKKLLFAAVATLLFFVVMELLLRLVGVHPLLVTEDPFVGFESKIPLFVEQTSSDGTKVLTTADNKLSLFNKQTFPKRKAQNTYRIFCLGGSTTYGRPYDDTTSFSGWLRELLTVTDPSRYWEVINAGGISYASYRITVLMEELAACEPDLFVIYSGHNEFLERRTYGELLETPSWVTSLVSQLGKTSIYTVFKRVYEAAGDKTVRPQEGRFLLPDEVDAVLDHAVGLSTYTRDDTLKQQVIEHYKLNLIRMVELGRSAGAEVVLVTPASNLKDCSPFKSEHKKDLSIEDIRQFQAYYAQAMQLEKSNDLVGAINALAQAEVIDHRYAELLYRKGGVLYKAGRYEEAKRALQQARDEDICPLRALTPMADIVRQVAEDMKVPLVDFAANLDRRSAHEITDAQIFLDHVHLTIEGNRLLALSLIDQLAEDSIVHISHSWNDAAILKVVESVEQKLDNKAHAQALINLSKVLSWAGKAEEASRLIAKASEVLPDDHTVLFMTGIQEERTGNLAAAEECFRKTIEIVPNHAKAHYNLARLLSKKGDPAGAIEHYRQALRADPGYIEATCNLAGLLYSQGKTAEGIAQIKEALRIDPDNTQALYNLGILLAGQGETDQAIEYYLHTVRVAPQHVKAHYKLTILLAEQGKIDAAIHHCREAIRYQPDYAEAYFNLGALLARQGRIVEAVNYMKEALRIKPDMPGAQEKLAMIEAELRRRQSTPNGSAASK